MDPTRPNTIPPWKWQQGATQQERDQPPAPQQQTPQQQQRQAQRQHVMRTQEGIRPRPATQEELILTKQNARPSFLDAFNMATTGTTPQQAIAAHQKGLTTTSTPFGALYATPQKTYEFGMEVSKQAALNIIAPYAGGVAIGAASGAMKGYLLGRNALTGLRIYQTAETAAGLGLTGYSVYDVGRTYQEQGANVAAVKGLQLGSSFLFMGAGYVSGVGKGYPYGAQRGLESFLNKQVQSGKLPQDVYGAALGASRARYSINKQLGTVDVQQPSPRFTDIQSLQQQPGLRTYFEQKLATGKGEIFGGAASNKPMGTHDLDVMLKPKEIMFSKYASKEIGAGDMSQYADIKPVQRAGKIVGELGTVKQPSVTTSEGYRLMRWQEQFSRLSGSSLRPAHEGRLKDIPESVRMLDQIIEGKNISPKFKADVENYRVNINKIGELGTKNPLIRSTSETEALYGKSFGERFYRFREKAWEKLMPEKMKQADVERYAYKGGTAKVSSEGYLPPSLKAGYSPRSISFSFSMFMSKSLKPYSPSVSVSSPSYPSKSPSYVPPRSPSYPSPSLPVSPSYTPPSIPYSPSKSTPYTSPKSPSYAPPYSPSKSSSRSMSVLPSFMYPKKKYEGVGMNPAELREYQTRYKFREFKIPSLEKILGGAA